MDQALLVKSDRDIAAKVIEALNQAAIPVTLFDWIYVPQLEEWQLIIASPWVDTKGPHAANRALVDALRRAGVYEDVPMRRIFLRGPNDPIVKTLQREATEQNQGFLHILRHQDTGEDLYSVIFAPTTSVGGVAPMKEFSTVIELRKFLSRLSLKSSSIKEVVYDVERSGVASLYPIMLTKSQIRQFGLG
jgi:hypothetical protein